QQSLCDLVTKFWRRRFSFELPDEFVFDRKAKFVRGILYGLPTNGSIRAEFLALDKRNLFVAKLGQILHGELRSASVVQNDVRYTGNFAVAGYSDQWNLCSARNRSVHSDQPFDGALL